jgi:hypothetical protein
MTAKNSGRTATSLHHRTAGLGVDLWLVPLMLIAQPWEARETVSNAAQGESRKIELHRSSQPGWDSIVQLTNEGTRAF